MAGEGRGDLEEERASVEVEAEELFAAEEEDGEAAGGGTETEGVVGCPGDEGRGGVAVFSDGEAEG